MKLEFNKPYTCDIVNDEGQYIVRLNPDMMQQIYNQYMRDMLTEDITSMMGEIIDRYGFTSFPDDYTEEIIDNYIHLVMDEEETRNEDTAWNAVEMVLGKC